ncbi:MAG: hypothetical protein ABUJ92_09115 [Desulfobacterales bacterium]
MESESHQDNKFPYVFPNKKEIGRIGDFLATQPRPEAGAITRWDSHSVSTALKDFVAPEQIADIEKFGMRILYQN